MSGYKAVKVKGLCADDFSCVTIEDEAEMQAKALMEQFKKDNPNAKR